MDTEIVLTVLFKHQIMRLYANAWLNFSDQKRK